MLALRLDLEATLAQASYGGVEVGDDDGEMPGRGNRRLLRRHQVHLRPLALQPGEFGERRRRFDPHEPDQLEEADSGLDVSGSNLDSDVVEHVQRFTETFQLRMFLSAMVSTMEAAVAEKEAGMTEWNDGRLDDLCKRTERIERKVDEQGKAMQKEFAKQGEAMQKEFARVDQKFTGIDGQFERIGERFDEVARGFGRVESELVRVNDRLDGFHRSMTWAAWVMVIGMLGLLGVLTGIVADKV